jgi:hypothetical protein
LTTGQSVNGEVEGITQGKLKIQVSAGYVAGLAATQSQELRVSNIRTIAFDGRDDYYKVILKNGEIVEGTASALLKGRLHISGSEPIRISTVKELIPTAGPAEKGAAELTMLDLAIGHTGTFKHALLVGFIFEKGFVGQLNFRSPANGNYETKIVVIRGVDTAGLTSGSWAKLNQEVKVSRTEKLDNGDTVLVAEPVDPTKTNVSPAEPMGGADSRWRRVQPVEP